MFASSRCLPPVLMVSTEILSRLQLYSEAASQLVRFHSASSRGSSLLQSGPQKTFFNLLPKALPLFAQKGWDFAEDHIVYTLSSQNEFNNSPEFAIECASRLLRQMDKQTPSQQAIFLAHYVKILRKYRGHQTSGHLVLQ
uniref:Uncharacterized protein n=1 Tax=Ditylenchus dipsaci TaxID=166011 RepID=A0A915E183_9BILA